MADSLDRFLVPVVSGLTLQPKGRGALSRERAARLDEQLRELRRARSKAGMDARTYLVGGTR